MLKVTTRIADNETEQATEIEIKKEKDMLFLNDALFEWDIIQINESNFHILYQNVSYNVEILQLDSSQKTLKLRINEAIYQTKAQDKFDLLLQKLGMDKVGAHKVGDIKAPMPGLIVEVKVGEGQEIKQGDALLILEAMKMENVLKSPMDGKIKAIKVQKGDNVEKNQVLLMFE